MARPEIVVLIPESTRKRRGGRSPVIDEFGSTLPPRHRTALDALRQEVRDKTNQHIAEPTSLLPAYERFDGNMYRHIPTEAWERRAAGVEVLIASGLLGLVASRDTIPSYAHSMAERMPPLGKLNRWWHDSGLPDILRAYLMEVRPKQVVDLLSLEYREAVAGYRDDPTGIEVTALDFPGMGRGSQPKRGERISDILLTGRI